MPKRGFIFNSVSFRKVKRNAFNLDYENKFTGNMGELLPFFVQDVVPHDTFKVGNEYLMRLMPLYAPIMHRVDIRQHYFNVPLRLIWEDFEKFVTGGEDGQQTAEMPYITLGDIYTLTHGSTSSHIRTRKLLDLLGYPTFSATDGTPQDSGQKFSTLRIRAYNFIYNSYYRAQDIQLELLNSKESGHDIVSGTARINFLLQNRCWKKDYFTSALTSPQRGPSVGIPWSGGTLNFDNSKETILQQKDGDTYSLISSANMQYKTADPATHQAEIISNGAGGNVHFNVDNSRNLSVDSLDIDINNFRRSLRVQEWLERNNIGGARYIEQILSHFGIRPKDYRLDRPEHLGGGCQPLGISDVVQVSASTATSPQGTQAGKGLGFNSMRVFKQTFDEHCIIIGLISVLPRTGYQQGVSRHLFKFDKFDFLQPEFSNIGEQEVYNKELYLDKSSSAADADDYNNGVFGFQSRYSEYKYTPDEVHGDFKDSLSYWHLGRIFANRPNLNTSFLVSDPSKRVFNVTSTDVDALLFDVYNHCTAVRCLSAYGTPTL